MRSDFGRKGMISHALSTRPALSLLKTCFQDVAEARTEKSLNAAHVYWADTMLEDTLLIRHNFSIVEDGGNYCENGGLDVPSHYQESTIPEPCVLPSRHPAPRKPTSRASTLIPHSKPALIQRVQRQLHLTQPRAITTPSHIKIEFNKGLIAYCRRHSMPQGVEGRMECEVEEEEDNEVDLLSFVSVDEIALEGSSPWCG
jgi:hypothetical protein